MWCGLHQKNQTHQFIEVFLCRGSQKLLCNVGHRKNMYLTSLNYTTSNFSNHVKYEF